MTNHGSTLTLEAVATRLAVGRSTVQRLIRTGSLPALRRIGSNRVLIRVEDLEKFIASNRDYGRRPFPPDQDLNTTIESIANEELAALAPMYPPPRSIFDYLPSEPAADSYGGNEGLARLSRLTNGLETLAEQTTCEANNVIELFRKGGRSA
jgi:excisionase family DNA binding protein